MMSKAWTCGATFIQNWKTLPPPREDDVVFTSFIFWEARKCLHLSLVEIFEQICLLWKVVFLWKQAKFN